MLALWSRVARSPGTCRCTSCLSNGSATTKRRGAIGLWTAWALGAPTSTFAYTAVFAAGLAVDAKAKRDRSAQWDAAFANLQQEKEHDITNASRGRRGQVGHEAESLGDESFDSVEGIFSEGMDWDAIHRVSGMEIDHHLISKSTSTSADNHVTSIPQESMNLENIPESFWDLLSYDSRLPSALVLEWPANTGPGLIRHYLPPQSLWAPEHMRLRAMRRRQVRKKLAIQEFSVGMLIHSLLRRTKAWQLDGDALASLSPQLQEVAAFDYRQMDDAARRIRDTIYELRETPAQAATEEFESIKLETAHTAIPQYFQDSDGDYHSICNQMNMAIKDIFSQDYPDDAAVAVATAKICHNLLISTAAPDLHTINMLITGFGRWKRPEMVDAVIAARERCKIRPNEITCAAILNHYVQNDRPEHFSKFIAKMRGVGNPLMLARPDITINETSSGRVVRYNERKVKQKVFPTPLVFNTLMLGVLKFAGFHRALEVYYEMKDDGWGMDILGLRHFLEDCLRRKDWEGGSYVWGEIDSIKRGVKPGQMTMAYAQMLSLCSITGKTVAYNHVLNDVVRRGFNRKRILELAENDTTHQEKPDLSTAPPWTVDNVLIAVSGYLNDHEKSNSQEATPPGEVDGFARRGGSVDPEEGSRAEAALHGPLRDTHTTATGAKKIPVKDANEAWALWMHHELGEPVAPLSPEMEDTESQGHTGKDSSFSSEDIVPKGEGPGYKKDP